MKKVTEYIEIIFNDLKNIDAEQLEKIYYSYKLTMIDRVIVFDLDHTIGDFLVIGMIWKFFSIKKCNMNQIDFNNICNIIFCHFFHPYI